MDRGSRSESTCVPGIDRMFESIDIALLVVVVGGGSVHRNDLLDRHQATARNVIIADQLVPDLKAILPALHLSIPAAILIHTGTIRYAAQIAQRHRGTCLSRRPKGALMLKEGQREGGVNPILHTQIVQRLSLASGRRIIASQHLVDKSG